MQKVTANGITVSTEQLIMVGDKEKTICLDILRLDQVDKEISGNKIFKLHYYIEDAIKNKKRIVTFGGAFSNHLVATAALCHQHEIGCLGIVRGEPGGIRSHTLLKCENLGMELQFITREEYKRRNDPLNHVNPMDEYGDCVLIPEGGFGKNGMLGANLITNYYPKGHYSHICCVVGTATTLAGLVKNSDNHTQHIGYSALKGLDDFEKRMQLLLDGDVQNNYILKKEFHFGGYAKTTPELVTFMNHLYREYTLKTDFVYTAKMMFGVFEMIKSNYFRAGSRILCIHTGGLQGNDSLPPGALIF